MRRLAAVVCVIAACAAAACQKNVVQPFPSNYVGIGVELTMRDELPVVVRTIAGGPAARAGLATDDQLLSIDNSPTSGQGLADIVVRLRGREGSSVYVTLRRHGVEMATSIVRSSMEKDGEDYTSKLRAAAK